MNESGFGEPEHLVDRAGSTDRIKSGAANGSIGRRTVSLPAVRAVLAADICFLRALTAGNFTPFVLLWIQRARCIDGHSHFRFTS